MTIRIELAERRGRLRERIAAQRTRLAHDMAPISNALAFTGRLSARYHRAAAWMREHPVLAGTVVAALVLLRPRRTWKLARWGLLGWRLWRASAK